jgi:alkylation response protein AidB-like acyl-CoA dehydrogenase
VSKPISAINRYKADMREIEFLLFDQFRLREILGKGPYEAWGPDEVKTTLSECYRWVREVIGPLNAIGDAEGCRLENGHVVTPTGFRAAWNSLYEAGWKSVAVRPEHGGAGAPHAVQLVIEELISGANTAFAMYAGLTYGASELIAVCGTKEQQELFCGRMFSGKWGGTMCLTEPHCGSDVGSAKTTAQPNGDGTYTIRGTKIFISAGDHDFTENIVHMVLARVNGAPEGTKGLTLFIVPKFRTHADGSLAGSNDVSVGNIEHKMGINGNSTCELNFGENG